LMFRRTNNREEAAGVEHRIAEILEAGAVKVILARFDGVVLCALALKLDAGAAGLNLKLLYGFNGNAQTDGPAFALLNRIRNGRALDKDIFREPLGAVDLAPAITLRNTRQKEDEGSGVSRALTNSGSGDRGAHRQRQVRIKLVANRGP